MNKEHHELLFRLLVAIVSGFILKIWGVLICLIVIIQFFHVLITKKRNKAMVDFCHLFTDQVYKYLKYVTFASNDRVFPFAELGKLTEKPVYQ